MPQSWELFFRITLTLAPVFRWAAKCIAKNWAEGEGSDDAKALRKC